MAQITMGPGTGAQVGTTGPASGGSLVELVTGGPEGASVELEAEPG